MVVALGGPVPVGDTDQNCSFTRASNVVVENRHAGRIFFHEFA